MKNPALNHSARTTAAAVVSLLVARAVGLPEIYWAVVSTLTVMQSSVATSWPVAARRFAGAALGATAGALLGTFFPQNIWVFAVGLFLLGLLCALLGRINKQLHDNLDQAAYNYAGVTLVITILIPRSAPIWTVAIHRFFEVSIGIAVALLMTALWPEKEKD